MKKELLGLTIILCALIVMIVIHEEVHKNNCRYFGGTPSNINFKNWSPGITCYGANTPERHLGDTINDAIGYTIIPIFMMYLAIKI